MPTAAHSSQSATALASTPPTAATPTRAAAAALAPPLPAPFDDMLDLPREMSAQPGDPAIRHPPGVTDKPSTGPGWWPVRAAAIAPGPGAGRRSARADPTIVVATITGTDG